VRRRFAVLVTAACLSLFGFGAAACGGVEEDVRKQAEEQVEEGRTQIEQEVEEGRTQIEQEAQEVQKQVEEKVEGR
jgi:ElaB/YqjD/DUF883 family membrane-anchored ribosome-binding protein